MISVQDIGRDFMPKREEEFRQPFIPQAPTAPTPIGIPPPQPVSGGQVVTAQPQPFTPVSGGIPSIGIGQPQFTPVGGVPQAGIPEPVTAMQPEAPAVGAGGFPYPEQWETASTALTELAQTGMPGMTPEYAQQAWLPYKRQAEQQAMQAREQAGLTGMRWSSPLAGQLEETWAGAGERFGSEMERMRMQDIAGQRGARLGAAAGLGGLGGQYAQLPLTVAQSMMGLGGAQQQMQQQELDRQREEWLRQQSEYNPLLQYMAGGAQMPTGPSLYGPSMGGQMFDVAGQMQMAQMMGLFGGGGTPTAPLGGGTYPEEWGQFR